MGGPFQGCKNQNFFCGRQANQKFLFRWLLRILSSRLRNGGFWTEVLKPSKRVDYQSAERFMSPRTDLNLLRPCRGEDKLAKDKVEIGMEFEGPSLVKV